MAFNRELKFQNKRVFHRLCAFIGDFLEFTWVKSFTILSNPISGRTASSSQGYPVMHLGGERHCESAFAEEHNAMSPEGQCSNADRSIARRAN